LIFHATVILLFLRYVNKNLDTFLRPFYRLGLIILTMEINMKMSDSIAQLAEALSKAQGQIDDATKTGVNPHFRSKYADLAAVRSVIREPLAVNDISVIQAPRTPNGEVEVETMLLHKSGEYISETLRLPVGKWDAHGIGSGISYARRYGLMSILALAADDDDGNGAVEKTTSASVGGVPTELLKSAKLVALQGTEALSVFWKGMLEQERDRFSADIRKELKAIATAADKNKEAA
jgi:hypothetical protein